jgi:hypothetical protein
LFCPLFLALPGRNPAGDLLGLFIWTGLCSTMFLKISVEDLDFHHSTIHCKGLLGLSKSLGFGFLWHTAAKQHKVIWGGRNYHHWSQFLLLSAQFQQVCNCIACHVLKAMCRMWAVLSSTKKITFFPFCICDFSVLSKV